MRRTRYRAWAAAAALAFGLFGLGLAQAADLHPPGVRVEATDESGPVLADPNGRTLYTWRGDNKVGASNCNDDRPSRIRGAGSVIYELPEQAKRPTCQQVWPPFLAAADAKPAGDWSLVARKDGSRQWAYQNKPLYTFIQDKLPGELNGMGGYAGRVQGRYPAWAPMDAPRGVTAAVTSAGRVLMTEAGKVLYAPDNAARITKASTGADSLWRPLAAPAIADAPKGWSIVTLADGRRQWAYQGRPVFTYAGDYRFADLNGQEEPGWKAVALQKRLPPPAELRVEMTGEGQVFADANGMTLYSYGCQDEAPDRILCDIPGSSETYRLSICGKPEVCIKTWRPVVASPGAKPVGRTWTIVTVDPAGAHQYAAPGQADGLRVWAYRGRPVYTFAKDKRPGDMNGESYNNGGLWGYGMIRAEADSRGQF